MDESIRLDSSSLVLRKRKKNIHYRERDVCVFGRLQVSGTIENTGQSLVFRIDKDSKYVLNITEGPLTYRYQLQEFYIHFGTNNNLGSEHKIQGYSFPAEVTIPENVQILEKPKRARLSRRCDVSNRHWRKSNNDVVGVNIFVSDLTQKPRLGEERERSSVVPANNVSRD